MNQTSNINGWLDERNVEDKDMVLRPDAATLRLVPFALHRHLYEALDAFRESAALRNIRGDDFVILYSKVKELEYSEIQRQITEWERDELMFSV